MKKYSVVFIENGKNAHEFINSFSVADIMILNYPLAKDIISIIELPN